MKRRQFTPALERRINEYYQAHGHTATLKKYRIVSSVLHRMRAKARPKKPPLNGLEAVSLLRQAWKMIEHDVQGGAKIRDADLYVKLALNHLTRANKGDPV